MAFDIELAAATIFMEASGESPDGRRAVAWVIVNRLNSGKWGNTLASVCLWPFQFSGWNTSDPNRIRMAQTLDDDAVMSDCEVAINVALAGGVDPTQGSMFYKVVGTNANWTEGKIPVVTIGNHEFYNDVA